MCSPPPCTPPQLAEPLKSATTLRVLDIGGNNIGPQGIKVLVEALKGHEALRSLELGYNPIGPEGVKSLVEVAKYDLQVRTASLAAVVFVDARKLVRGRLHRHWLWVVRGTSCQAVCHPGACTRTTDLLLQIETLKVGWCKIGGAEGAKAVGDLLMFNTSLQLLDLRGNGLGNDGAILVSRALREHTNEQLRELDLGYNEIKDDGACAIAQVGGCGWPWALGGFVSTETWVG